MMFIESWGQGVLWVVGLSLVYALSFLWLFFRERVGLRYGNLPTAPGLSWRNNHETMLIGTKIGHVYQGWFEQLGRTLILRVPFLYRPVILSSDPLVAGYVQRNVNQFEISPRLQLVTQRLGLPTAISAVHGDQRKRVKRALGTAFSNASMKGHWAEMVRQATRVRDRVLVDLSERDKVVTEGRQTQTEPLMVTSIVTQIMVGIAGSCIFGRDPDSEQDTSIEMERVVKRYYIERLSLSLWDRLWLYNKCITTSKTRKIRAALLGISAYARRLVDQRIQSLESAQDQAAGSVAEDDQTNILTMMCRTTLDPDVKSSHQLTRNELADQVPIMVIASTDVTCISLTYLFHTLATHPHVQDKLRQELSKLSNEPSLLEDRKAHLTPILISDSDEVNKLPYLDAVIEESLRLSNPYVNVDRTATQDSIIPLKYPVRGKNGQMMDAVPVKKGTEIRLSLHNINRDEDLFGKDAEDFRPERFLDETCSARAAEELCATWGKSLGFAGGGRGCPVFHYPLAATKAAAVVLLRSFVLSEPPDQTVVSSMQGNGGISVNGKIMRNIPIIFTPLPTEGP